MKVKQTRITKPKVTAYLKEDCGWSRGIRSVLENYGLLFEEKQVHIPENYQEMILKSGQNMQPTLILDDVVLSDVSGKELETYLLSNKYIQETISQSDGVNLDAPCTPEEEEAKVENKTTPVTMTKATMGFLGGVG